MPPNYIPIFRFQDLPPELRVQTYKHVTLDVTRVKLLGNGSIAALALALASRQIRSEFVPVWEANNLATVTTIDAEILNFDFDALLRTLKAGPEGFHPALNIEFKFEGPVSDYLDGLGPWLLYCADASADHPRASYTVDVHLKQRIFTPEFNRNADKIRILLRTLDSKENAYIATAFWDAENRLLDRRYKTPTK